LKIPRSLTQEGAKENEKKFKPRVANESGEEAEEALLHGLKPI